MAREQPAGGLPTDAATWDGLIAALREDQNRAARALDAIAERRRPVALDAVTGSPSAQKQVAALNGEDAALRASIETLRDAIADAQARRDAAAASEREAIEAARRERLREAALVQVALAGEVDRAARALAEAFAAFNAGVAPLGKLGLGANEQRKLSSPARRMAALHAADLHTVLPLERMRPTFWQPLEALARRMLATATGEAPPAPAMPGSFVQRPAPPQAAGPEPEISDAEEAAEDALARKLLRGGDA
jgi:hypothetical protein